MIDPGLLKFLTNTEQEALRDFEILFESRGWKRIRTLIEDQLVVTKNELILAPDWSYNRMAFGRLQILERLVGLQEILAQEFDLKAREREEEKRQKEVDNEMDFE